MHKQCGMQQMCLYMPVCGRHMALVELRRKDFKASTWRVRCLKGFQGARISTNHMSVIWLSHGQLTYFSTMQVEELLYRIGKPLGFSPIIRNSDRKKFLQTLGVPCRSGLVHYTDMYEHLSRRCIGITDNNPLRTVLASHYLGPK